MNKYLKAIVLLNEVSNTTDFGDEVDIEFMSLIEKKFGLKDIGPYFRWDLSGLEEYINKIISFGSHTENKKLNEDYLLDLFIAFIKIGIKEKCLESAKHWLS